MLSQNARRAVSKGRKLPYSILVKQIWRCTTISELMINERIRDKEVRVIGQDGEQLGIR